MDLVPFAYESGLRAAAIVGREERKRLGQFMTPPSIAKAMANQACVNIEKASVRILEPVAGTGVLAAAVVEALLTSHRRPGEIDIVLCEIDSRLKPALKRLADRMRRAGASKGVRIAVSIRTEDFLLSDISGEKFHFDIIIANPPYFKLKKWDPRSVKHAYAVYGQPNIYGLFMAACARLLTSGGRWCFITPRSWTNGTYFAFVRRQVLRWLHIEAMHIFESRREHFTEDEILQEAMITWASAQANTGTTIVVSTSQGASDLSSAVLRTLPSRDIIGTGSQGVISLPALDRPDSPNQLTATLSTYDIRVSTGPVVAFRAIDYISQVKQRNTVPLLWMQHIGHMRVSWPIRKKREHIEANLDAAWMLIPNANMVVIRRFSPKEAPRRVTAAPYLAGSIPGPVIGLENHTNYLYRFGSEMTAHETKGIAAYLNSRIVDRFFREIAGNTQVNASDLRSLPLPSLGILTEIGRSLPDNCTLEEADRVVDSIFQIETTVRVA
jgi:adenine-specific DNA-methyltransferase